MAITQALQTAYAGLDAMVGGVLPGGAQPSAGVQQITQTGAFAPTAAAMPAVRGKTMTAIATVYPDGRIVPKKITTGGVALYRRDLTAAKRVKRVQKEVNRLFPARRSYQKKGK